MIPFGIQLLTFVVMFAFYGGFGTLIMNGSGHSILLRLGLIPVCLIQVMIIGFGCGLLFSSLTAVYRDLQHILGFLMQIWMYLTPVIYPMSQFPAKWSWLPKINPLSVPVEGIRFALLGTGTLSVASVALSWGISLALLLAGFASFNRTEKSFIDRA
jgi:lipopolysaccharide transport system permease protein